MLCYLFKVGPIRSLQRPKFSTRLYWLMFHRDSTDFIGHRIIVFDVNQPVPFVFLLLKSCSRQSGQSTWPNSDDFAERSKDFSGWSPFFGHHDKDIVVHGAIGIPKVGRTSPKGVGCKKNKVSAASREMNT
jgi:hypothetical protein